MEDAARTEDDFREVIKAWDKEDANRERRERYHEVGRDDTQVPLEYNMSRDEIVIPAPIHSVYWRQIMKGLHEKHKALFFFIVVRGYTTSYLASLYGQSDRNIRKVRATIERKIHKKLIPILEERIKNNYGLTLQERRFLESHCKKSLSVV